MTDSRLGGRATIFYNDGADHTIDLGTVTKMTRTIQKKSTSTPIVSLDMQSAFPIESGNSQTVSISFSRKNGQDGLTNAQWYTNLTSFIDRWQARTNGCLLTYTPNPDNHYIGDGFSNIGCYIKRITRSYSNDFNEVIKGTIDFTVGTMHVNDTNPTSAVGAGSLEPFSAATVLLSDSDRVNWYAIYYGGYSSGNPGQFEKYNCIDSLTITGGVEDPFETATITLSKKKLAEQIPDLHGDIIDGMNGLMIYCMGKHTMYVDQVKKSNQTITIRGITYAQSYQQRALSVQTSNTPFGHITNILSDNSTGISYGQNLVTNYDPALDSDIITFPDGTKYWRVLQICATMLRCRIFFADDKVYLLDYTKCIGDGTGPGDQDVISVDPQGRYKDGTLWVPSVDLQGGDNDFFKKRIVSVGGIDDDGFAPVKNHMTLVCTENGVQKNAEYKDEYSVKVYDEQTKGTVQVAELDESQAKQFGKNHLLYVRESQRSITFTLKELYGSSGQVDKAWKSYFGPSAQVGVITDEDSSEVLTNISELDDPDLDGELTPEGYVRYAYQKLCLSSYKRRFPDGTCEYTFGTVANVDLSNFASQTSNTFNAPR